MIYILGTVVWLVVGTVAYMLISFDPFGDDYEVTQTDDDDDED